MSNDKDIYEVLNDIEFDITSEMEIPMVKEIKDCFSS